MEQSVKIILASGSPRRKELFERAGISFSVIKSGAKEVMTKTIPAEAVQELAAKKAADVKERLSESDFLQGLEQDKNKEGIFIVGADTIVVSEGIVLGKPGNEEEAFRMLMSLSGRTHSVFTGVCGIYLDREGKVVPERGISFAEETFVTMYPFMEEEARAYIRTGEPMDKAGAYGIQGLGGLFVKEIRGDYQNVVGFPLAAFWRLGCQKNFFRL